MDLDYMVCEINMQLDAEIFPLDAGLLGDLADLPLRLLGITDDPTAVSGRILAVAQRTFSICTCQ